MDIITIENKCPLITVRTNRYPNFKAFTKDTK